MRSMEMVKGNYNEVEKISEQVCAERAQELSADVLDRCKTLE